MKPKLLFFIFLVIGMPVNSSQAQQPQYDWTKLRQVVADNTRDGKPMTYSQEALQQLGLREGCDALKANLKDCAAYRCITKLNLPFGGPIFSDILIQGYNSQNQCVFSTGGQRYWIPKDDLATFNDVFFATTKAANQNTNASLAGSSTEIKYTKEIDGITCSYAVEIDMASDGGSKMTYKNINLAPNSPAACKTKKVTYIEDLNKMGLVATYDPEPIGIGAPSFSSSAQAPTNPIQKPKPLTTSVPTTQVAPRPSVQSGRSGESANGKKEIFQNIAACEESISQEEGKNSEFKVNPNLNKNMCQDKSYSFEFAEGWTCNENTFMNRASVAFRAKCTGKLMNCFRKVIYTCH